MLRAWSCSARRTLQGRASNGRQVGSLSPGLEVRDNDGWQDMSHANQELERNDSEDLVLDEGDRRGKNVLSRGRAGGAWRAAGN
jgi:hypothetical protein